MKKLLPIIILMFAVSVYGQSKPSAKKPKSTNVVKTAPSPQPTPVAPVIVETKPIQKVIVEKTNGDRFTGLLVRADTESLIVQISDANLPIRLSEIKAIWFGEIPQPVVVENKIDYVAEALKSLRKLTAATDVGVNFQDYSRRVIDVKAEVENLLPGIADEYVKNEIKSAMDAYADASSAWNFAVKNRGYLFIEFEPALTLQPKYNLATEQLGRMTLISNQTALSKIWATAKNHIENAQKGKP